MITTPTIIISKRPKCRTCGEYLKEWDPWAEVHEHDECLADRISKEFMHGFKDAIDKSLKNISHENKQK